MDTLEWGKNNDYDDFELDDVDNQLDSFVGLSYNPVVSSFYEDLTASTPAYTAYQPQTTLLQAALNQNSSGIQDPSTKEEATGLFRFDGVPTFFGQPIKQEPSYSFQHNTQAQSVSFQHTQPNFFTAQTASVVPHVEPKIETNQGPSKRVRSSMESDSHTELDIRVESQPPVEVRTRTPSEIRTFSVSAKVLGKFRAQEASIMKVALAYAPNSSSPLESVKKDILGGTKTVALLVDGSAIFDNLWISESSTKHKEREFCIEFILLRNDGHELVRKQSKAFYAYSHKKVLQRRGNVKLRTLSKTWGRLSGGDQMHVIGAPFIQGPALSLVFRTPHGDVAATPLEYFSDSVLFFELPPYPLPEGVFIAPDAEVKVQVLLTNDGRTYSNPIDFTYIADNTPRSRF